MAIVHLIRADQELWSGSMMPVGALERWRRLAGDTVAAGDCVAEILVEGSLHEIVAPAAGQLEIFTGDGSIVEPDSVIGAVQA